jgi:hypothetical protein
MLNDIQIRSKFGARWDKLRPAAAPIRSMPSSSLRAAQRGSLRRAEHLFQSLLRRVFEEGE